MYVPLLMIDLLETNLFDQGGIVDKNEEEVTRNLNHAITLLTGKTTPARSTSYFT